MTIENEATRLINFMKYSDKLNYINWKEYRQSMDDEDIYIFFHGEKRRATRLSFIFSKFCLYSITHIERYVSNEFIWSFHRIVDITEKNRLMLIRDVFQSNDSFEFRDFLMNFKPFWNVYKKFNFQEMYLNLRLEML